MFSRTVCQGVARGTLTKLVVGQNQFTMDVAVDWLDSRADKASERIMELEGRMADMEDGYWALLALGQEQVQTSV